MWQLESPTRHDLPDTTRFLETLARHAAFFDQARPLVVGRAPGRLDLMGGIADYSGSLVLELPLGLAAFVAAQEADDTFVTVHSTSAGALGSEAEVRISLDALLAPKPSYTTARALFAADERSHWAAYVAGALVALAVERGLRPVHGVRLLLDSGVPLGKGVSSSAAVEVAAMSALCALYGVAMDGRELAILCQKVENLVVGAPCGVMDQMTSALGEADRLLALLCQPAEVQPPVALPAGVEVWGIDSGIRHAVSGADYGSVRVGAFMGYRIIADHAGLPVAVVEPGYVQVEDSIWGGYLANIAPAEWERHYRDHVPERLSGAAFLARYSGTTDLVTQVDPARTYAVRQPTAHPIYEHQRVRLFRALLRGFAPADAGGWGPQASTNNVFAAGRGPAVAPPMQLAEEPLRLLGELMEQSHASYGACGLGSDGTDRLVDLARELGPARGVYGAKITGGGSGGTVAILARAGSLDAIREVAARYERETGRTATLIGGSSPGAAAVGALWLVPTRPAAR
jgi:L-arabinokinase